MFLLPNVVVVVVAGSVPASLRRAKEAMVPGAWESIVEFFEREKTFRVRVDPTCVATDYRSSAIVMREDPSKPWFRPGNLALTHGKWSAEVWLPLVIRRSRWHARLEDAANATLVVFRSRGNARHALSQCRLKLARHSPRYGRDHWFTAFSSRGPCCDGGQLRDPGLARHHFLTHAGELSDGPWLFRESRFADHLGRASQYKAPVTRDTSSFVRCFDKSKDVALPPPSFLLRKDGGGLDFSPHNPKDILLMHAEGRQGGMEYNLRRDMTIHWDPTWTSKNSGEREKQRRVGRRRHPGIFVRFAMPKDNYTDAMRRARYCVVSEGFSPWSPRLAEAVAHGCVPVLLSPSLDPPYSSVLDWSKFSVSIQAADIPRLPELLEPLDHASLHRDLLRVRPLFAFCIDQGGEDDCGGNNHGDGLPLVIFEMAHRHTTHPAGTDFFDAARDDRGTAHLLTNKDTYAPIDYSCHASNGTCDYRVNDQNWRCDMVNKNACQCRLNANLVGSSKHLVGHRTYLWT
ncbi:hypothetical protein CTAYLR_006713 [Chrysophaeum taylorii]|uniref:Exostosin GT47 domain-containing protein n=1 Tax=Chrysophaeum taylorii TaxID=2483200 RepID=A0AAD7UBP3_9STRA|nr:hypothetical protein CTAYLR_006713 [Chrysophaeum taylorii]